MQRFDLQLRCNEAHVEYILMKLELLNIPWKRLFSIPTGFFAKFIAQENRYVGHFRLGLSLYRREST